MGSVSRALRRNKAKHNLKKDGWVRIMKGNPSFFALHWREYVSRRK